MVLMLGVEHQPYTARPRTSGEYVFGRPKTPSSQMMEPFGSPGRFTWRCLRICREGCHEEDYGFECARNLIQTDANLPVEARIVVD